MRVKLTTAMKAAGMRGGNLVKVSSLCSHSLSGVCFTVCIYIIGLSMNFHLSESKRSVLV